MANFMTKGYDEVLNETHDLFKSQGVSIIGAGYSEIATNPSLLESYIESLCEGVSADHQAVMAALMENSNKQMLMEASITGITPIASLSMPVIRKLWPKFALKDVPKEEVTKTPNFVVSYTKPYLFRAGENGEEDRIYLPRGMKSTALLKNEIKKAVVARKISTKSTAGDGTASNAFVGGATLDLSKTVEEVKVTGVTSLDNTISGNYVATTKVETGSAIKVQPIDSLALTNITLGGKVVAYKKNMDISKSIFVNVADDVQIIAKIADAAKGHVFVAVVGAPADLEFTVEAAVSTEYNEMGYSVAFDIGRMDVAIPTGEHINAPLPIEAINDMMALYQIDGTKETVELMTDVISQKLDLEVLEFLSDSYFEQPDDYPAAQDYKDIDPSYTNADAFTYTFDVKPAPGFAGGPKAWREELKPMIDHLAQKIKNNTYFRTGMFKLVCNPIDAQLIQNIDWSFRGGQGATMDGVDVDYSIGTYTGANTYRVIASPLVPSGEMFVVFIPSDDNQMTYKYYPYSFNVEHGYIDNNRSRTPSIMMTKRCTFKSFTPAIGTINIVNNNGMGQFNTYIPTVNVGAWTPDEEGMSGTLSGWAKGDVEQHIKSASRLGEN